jgi:gluconolactonase
MHSKILVALLILILGCKQKKELQTHRPTKNTIGHIQIYDPRLLDILDTSSQIEILADSFTWAEGPLWLQKEQKLIFTDVPENTIYSWDVNYGKQVYLKPSGYTIKDSTGGTEGANGLALDKNNRLVLCQHGNRTVAVMEGSLNNPTPNFVFLTQKYNNKRFNSPNDLHIAKDGSIFFTDPPYGLPGLDTAKAKEISFNGIYRLRTDGSVVLIDSSLTKPNGIALSNDESKLYVANSDPQKAIYIEYKLGPDYEILSKRILSDKTKDVPSLKGLPDGLKVAKKDHIFATGPGGVLVFHADGTHLGTIMTENATANCALDEENGYLYMTSHMLLLRVKIK